MKTYGYKKISTNIFIALSFKQPPTGKKLYISEYLYNGMLLRNKNMNVC